MGRFSPTISNFLSQVGADEFLNVTEVPKSDSCALPGDFLLFYYSPKYQVKYIKGNIYYSYPGYRIVLVVEPVVKDSVTGNLLLTGFSVPTGGEYTPESLITLYKNRKLPDDDYRTFILGKPYVVGPLYKISKTEQEPEPLE